MLPLLLPESLGMIPSWVLDQMKLGLVQEWVKALRLALRRQWKRPALRQVQIGRACEQDWLYQKAEQCRDKE